MGDTDYTSRNFGLIYDEEKNEITAGPNFDFECAVKPNLMDEFNVEENFDKSKFPNMEFVYKKYNKIYINFMSNIKNLLKKNNESKKTKLYEFIEANYDKRYVECIYNILMRNINYIIFHDKYISKYFLEQQM